MEILKDIRLDINKKIFEKLEYRKGDSANVIRFIITNGGIPVNLTNRQVRFFAKKEDNTVIFNDCKVEDAPKGIVTIKLTNQTLSMPGVVFCELTVFENTDIVTSTMFELIVSDTVKNDTAIESTNEFNVFTNALKDLGDYKNVINGYQNVINGVNKDIEELKNKFNTAMGNVLLKLNDYWNLTYPIGYIWESTSNINPSVIYGGTWEQYGTGKVLVGVGSVTDTAGNSQTFNAGEVGGELKHKLTGEELPIHNHAQYVTTGTGGDAQRNDYDGDGAGKKYDQGIKTGNAGGDQPHNNLQPYVVIYRWRRTRLANGSNINLDDLLTEFLVNNLIDTNNIKDQAVTIDKINNSSYVSNTNYDVIISNTNTFDTSEIKIFFEMLNREQSSYNHMYYLEVTPTEDIYKLGVYVIRGDGTMSPSQFTSENWKAGEKKVISYSWNSNQDMKGLRIKSFSTSSIQGHFNCKVENLKWIKDGDNVRLTELSCLNGNINADISIFNNSDDRLCSKGALTEYKINDSNLNNDNCMIANKYTFDISNTNSTAADSGIWLYFSNPHTSLDGKYYHYYYIEFTPKTNIKYLQLYMLRNGVTGGINSQRDLVAGTKYIFTGTIESTGKIERFYFVSRIEGQEVTNIDGTITIMSSTNGIVSSYSDKYVFASSTNTGDINLIIENDNRIVTRSYLDHVLTKLFGVAVTLEENFEEYPDEHPRDYEYKEDIDKNFLI